MPAPHHLRAAPILEAIIDFRVRARAGVEQSDFEGLRGPLLARFPHSDVQKGGSITFQLTPTGVKTPQMQQGLFQGLVFRSADEKLIAQFRIDGFTLNRLKPYTRWEEFYPVALELWRLYCSVARPEGVSRVALRFINQIVFPAEAAGADFDRYMTMAPVVAPELPQTVTGFLTRTTIHDQKQDLSANIMQTFGADAASRMFLLLDIDAYREGAWATSDPGIETTFSDLRELKNLIFFSSLTETALRQFE
jgi:uncharacterized protein (TIGR04255 family)